MAGQLEHAFLAPPLPPTKSCKLPINNMPVLLVIWAFKWVLVLVPVLIPCCSEYKHIQTHSSKGWIIGDATKVIFYFLNDHDFFIEG
jgi:hypothetical protein